MITHGRYSYHGTGGGVVTFVSDKGVNFGSVKRGVHNFPPPSSSFPPPSRK